MLNDVAMLADVRVSVWQPPEERGARRRRDANLLRRTQSAYQAVHTRYKQLTLPWEHWRLLPTALFRRYMIELAALEGNARGTLAEWCGKEPDPAITDEIRTAFSVSLDFEPIPRTDGFGGLDPATTGKLGSRLLHKQDKQLAAAAAAMWTNTFDPITHMVERLTSNERFKSVTVENVRALVDLLPGWNVTADPLAGEVARDIENLFAGIDIKDLRTDPMIRAGTAQDAQRILDKILTHGAGHDTRGTG